MTNIKKVLCGVLINLFALSPVVQAQQMPTPIIIINNQSNQPSAYNKKLQASFKNGALLGALLGLLVGAGLGGFAGGYVPKKILDKRAEGFTGTAGSVIGDEVKELTKDTEKLDLKKDGVIGTLKKVGKNVDAVINNVDEKLKERDSVDKIWDRILLEKAAHKILNREFADSKEAYADMKANWNTPSLTHDKTQMMVVLWICIILFIGGSALVGGIIGSIVGCYSLGYLFQALAILFISEDPAERAGASQMIQDILRQQQLSQKIVAQQQKLITKQAV